MLALSVGIAVAPSAGSLLAQAPVPGASEAPLFLRNANVVDTRDGSVVRDATIEIREGRIVRVTASAPVPADVRVIDVGGRWVVPGLIDAHTHLATLDAARRALHSGVTTVRSASTPLFQDIAIREAVARGAIPGPDMLAAGVFVTPQLGETSLADPRLAPLYGTDVQSPEALRTVVRVNLDRGVDVIKTRGTERAGLVDTDPRQQTYDRAQLAVVVQEAATRNVPVLVHAHGDEGAYAAVAAGARSIEHGTYLSDSTLRLMRDRGAYLVPTLSTVVDLIEPGGDYDAPLLRLRGRHMLPRLEETIRRAQALGVPLVTGADTNYGPESETRIAHEVRRFAALGLTPLAALQAATTVAAELLQRADRIGVVAVGFDADLIVVERNPLEDLRVLEDPLVVVSNGHVALNRLPFGLRR